MILVFISKRGEPLRSVLRRGANHVVKAGQPGAALSVDPTPPTRPRRPLRRLRHRRPSRSGSLRFDAPVMMRSFRYVLLVVPLVSTDASKAAGAASASVCGHPNAQDAPCPLPR